MNPLLIESNIEPFLDSEFSELNQALDDQGFIARHETFCSKLGQVPPDAFNQIPAERRALWSERFIQCQRRYLGIMEREEAKRILASSSLKRQGPTDDGASAMLTVFGQNTYNRVRDLSAFLGDQHPQHIIMVGCGALPATLFWLHDHYPNMHSTGVDILEPPLELAARIASHLGLAGAIEFRKADGADVDYAEADFIYVANQVSPKREVLERIATTARKPVPVVVRDAAGPGWLLAEPLGTPVPDGFTLIAEGPVSPAFHSRDVFFQCGC